MSLKIIFLLFNLTISNFVSCQTTDNISKILISLKGDENCHPHFVVDKENSKYIATFAKGTNATITFQYIHDIYYKSWNKTMDLYFWKNLLKNEVPVKEMNILTKNTLPRQIDITKVKMTNNQVGCMIYFILLSPRPSMLFELNAIPNSRKMFSTPNSFTIPLTGRVGIFKLEKRFPQTFNEIKEYLLDQI